MALGRCPARAQLVFIGRAVSGPRLGEERVDGKDDQAGGVGQVERDFGGKGYEVESQGASLVGAVASSIVSHDSEPIGP